MLDLTLGQVAGFFSLGEVYHIWERSFIENQLCGCGKPFRQCDFWREVVDQAFGGWEQLDAHHMLRIQRSVARVRHIPYLAFPRLRGRVFQATLQEYTAVLEQLYTAIARISGSNVLIDSSKALPQAFILSEMPNLDVMFIHLVRDSRAVVYSWQRKKRRPEIYWKQEYMPVYGVLRGAIQEWMLPNLVLKWLSKKIQNFKLVKYEYFVKYPKDVITDILVHAGVYEQDFDFLEDNRVIRFGVNHTVSGNPLRFRYGRMEISLDEEWKKSMSLSHKVIVTLITMSLLKRYGYSLAWVNNTGDGSR